EALPSEQVSLLDAVGLVLAEDVVADVDVPPFANSAMDGYALRASDTVDAPRMLRVVATVAAGDVLSVPIGSGETARIMTGAPLPDGADSVIRFEETDERERGRDSGSIRIGRAVAAGENVRLAGED